MFVYCLVFVVVVFCTLLTYVLILRLRDISRLDIHPYWFYFAYWNIFSMVASFCPIFPEEVLLLNRLPTITKMGKKLVGFFRIAICLSVFLSDCVHVCVSVRDYLSVCLSPIEYCIMSVKLSEYPLSLSVCQSALTSTISWPATNLLSSWLTI